MKLDRVVRFMNATLLELECVRGQRKSLATRWHASRALILRALRFLGSARRVFAHDAVLWERLHALTTSYYPALNAAYRVREIPVISVVMHNRAVAWWLRHPQDPGVSLLHVDTHIDMNSVHVTGLKAAGRRALKRTDALDTLVWDIGAVVTAYLLLHGPRSVVWLYPRWITLRPVWQAPVQLLEPQKGRSDYVSPQHRALRYAMTPGPLPSRLSRATRRHELRYSQSQGQTRAQWTALARALGPRFLLDIDLDYFVTNGVKGGGPTETEKQSPHRLGRCNLTESPRYRFSDTRSMRQRNASMQKERKAINQRIDTFLRGLRQARNAGSRPTLISLSDSSSIISGLHEGVSWNNDYLPAQWALHVRTRVLRGLHRIYGGGNAAAPRYPPYDGPRLTSTSSTS